MKPHLKIALIHALEQMSYEYVKIEEESNLRDNFKCQLEKHNRKQLAEIGREHFTESEFEKDFASFGGRLTL